MPHATNDTTNGVHSIGVADDSSYSDDAGEYEDSEDPEESPVEGEAPGRTEDHGLDWADLTSFPGPLTHQTLRDYSDKVGAVHDAVVRLMEEWSEKGNTAMYNHYCSTHHSTDWFNDVIRTAMQGKNSLLRHSAQAHTESIHTALGTERGYNKDLFDGWTPFMLANYDDPAPITTPEESDAD